LTPLSKRGGAIELEVFAAVKMTFLIEMVVDRRMDRCQLLKRLRTPEFRHRSLTSPERLMRILGPIIEPPPGLLAFGISETFVAAR
jgi:hypothetical protein